MGKEQDEVFDCDKPLMPRWKKLKPALEAIKYGSYAYPAFAYVRDILGFEDINDNTVEDISKKLQDNAKPGFYKKIMQDLCGIEKAIQCVGGVEQNSEDYFVYLSQSLVAGNPLPVWYLEKITNKFIRSLDDYLDALQQHISNSKEEGAIGYKLSIAYARSIDFPAVSHSDAERAFIKLRSKVSAGISNDDRETLENFFVRRAIEACIDVDITVVIHTGYQAGVHNDIRNARATNLWSILRDYPDARFDLFHGSFPYVEDMTCLGKYFENVSLNMCWMHIMGPEISRNALRQWLDAVPVTKIFAFGGDLSVVEKIYGHLQLARADVAIVLAEKVERGRFKEDDALHIARLLFNENPKRWYKI